MRFISNYIADDPAFYQDRVWPQFCAIIIASACLYFLGKFLNRKHVDEETGEEVIRKKHSFFFIQVEYWVFIMPVLGAFALFIF